jgi:hypothetical protein
VSASAPFAPTSTSTPTSSPVAFRAIALFLAALAPRLWIALAWAKEPVWDGHYYDFGARRIAAGFGYSDDVIVGGLSRWHPWCHYPVGYSGFLGLVYKLFGTGMAVAPVANAVVGATLVSLVYLLVRRFGAADAGTDTRLSSFELRALAAAGLVALSPELLTYTALLMTEPLASVGPFAAGLAVAVLGRRHPLVAALVGGAIVGATSLVRPQSLVLAPALALLCRPAPAPDALSSSVALADLGKRLRVAVVALGAALLVVAPWTLRNCRVMDGCALVSTNGGWNLAIGALPGATGRFRTLRATDGCPVVTGQVQQDQCWRDEALAVIRRDPRAWLALVPKKLGFTFDHASFPLGYLGEADPQRWTEDKKRQGRELLTFTHRALLSLACLAFVHRPRFGRDRERRWGVWLAQGSKLAAIVGLTAYAAWSDEHPFYWVALLLLGLAVVPLPGDRPRTDETRPLVAFLVVQVAALVAIHSAFFGEDRYHVVVTPALCVLAALAFPKASARPPASPAVSPSEPESPAAEAP